MLGGAYLCYEGFEKLAHKLLHRRAKDDVHRVVGSDAAVDFVSAERAKVKGAVRTDFVLSAEIIVITLGTVARALFSRQLAVLVGISLLMTAFVYGLVAAIVKLDDGGLYLSRRAGDGFAARMQRRLGATVLRAAPLLMKALSIGGTAAMFLVGGGILAHDVPRCTAGSKAWRCPCCSTSSWASSPAHWSGAASGRSPHSRVVGD
jgi:uncharacterized protein